ncbi:hypothetical protein DPMN_083394 [Dreissena polymorpha]|uniref:Uncharacterized protein n=1 Tax=Dreissena polymorpha TaxID=45954 RepID=A0A9D4BHN6_DREPO|nr:hypothetical protein DPMN_083394 [Dreissena polymorpha]
MGPMPVSITNSSAGTVLGLQMSGSWVPCLFPSLIAQIRQGWATDEWIMGPMPVSITNSSAGTVLGLQISESRVPFLFPSPIPQIRQCWATDKWITCHISS